MTVLKRAWCALTHWRYRILQPAGMHRYHGHCRKCGNTWTETE